MTESLFDINLLKLGKDKATMVNAAGLTHSLVIISTVQNSNDRLIVTNYLTTKDALNQVQCHSLTHSQDGKESFQHSTKKMSKKKAPYV